MSRSLVPVLDDDMLDVVVAPPAAAVVAPPAPAPIGADDDVVEFDEPHAAMNAASPVAAAAPPILRPAIFRNRLRSTSSRASCSTTPVLAGPASFVVGSGIGSPEFVRSGLVARRSHLQLRETPRVRSLTHRDPAEQTNGPTAYRGPWQGKLCGERQARAAGRRRRRGGRRD